MSGFATTRWSIVLLAQGGPDEARAALETLCRTYRVPVLAYVRRHGYRAEATEDLVQSFFADFLERSYYANADPERGRFRAFLLTALKRFLIDADRGARRVKRGGNVHLSSLDSTAAEDFDGVGLVADADTPDLVFERAWALTLLESAMRKLRAEAAAAGKQALFDTLSEFITERPDEADYARAANELNLRRNTLAVAVHRLRHRLRELVREEMAETTADPADMRCEQQDLRRALNSSIVQRTRRAELGR